ncbi:MAG TPA: hypothetical protein ENK68_01105 [Epsilonproteobacteria bacterium]|nr:hypothetical protein [Campylobacterota bacterium]
MKLIEDNLEALDQYFAPKKDSEKWMMIGGIAGIIAYLAYTLLLPQTEMMYKTSETEKKRVEKSLKDNNTYLQSITVGNDRDYYVKKYDQEIKNKQEKIVLLKDKIVFVNKSIDKLSDMLFNQKSWSKFLDSITDRAEKQRVNIEYIHNKYADNNGSFGYVLEISVGCIGPYQNIVKFINEIEQNVLVTDVYGTQLTLDDNTSNIVADINISVWGINH